MLFIVSLIPAAIIMLTGANIAIQRKDNRADETCECGKSMTLSCIFKKNTFAVEWMDANDIKPIAKCLKQACSLNPDYVEKYNISFDMEQGYFDLTVQKVTMQLNGRKLVCSDGSNTASYTMSVKDYEPYLTDDSKSGSIKAASGCISQDTPVAFKWIKICASSNVEMEFNPESLVKSNTSCTNDSDCGNDRHMYYSEIIDAKASAEGKYYLKVIAIYGNESKESFSSNKSGQKYNIQERDEEQLKSDVVIITLKVLAAAACAVIFSVIVYRKKFRKRFCKWIRKISPRKKDDKGNEITSSRFQLEKQVKVYVKTINCAEYVNSIGNDEDVSFLSEFGSHDVNCMATKSTTVGLNPEFQSRNFTDLVRYEDLGVRLRLRPDESQSELNLSYSNYLHNCANQGTQGKRRLTWKRKSL